jgi:mannose-6-phosphate isomerase-like protein (cupin superfamily)
MAVRESFDLERIEAEGLASGRRYNEFLRVPALSCGMYILPAGGTDSQTPHTEDEIYHVLHGRATLDIGDHEHLVHPGSVIYVPANVPHRFHSIEEELKLLVVFAPAEGTSDRRDSRAIRKAPRSARPRR